MDRFEPIIKWSGSKLSVAPQLSRLIPSRNGATFFDPFLGGGSMLVSRPKKQPAVAADVLDELIELFKFVRDDPAKVLSEYRTRWEKLQCGSHLVYYEYRKRFNETRNPFDFLFLSRTCTNGLIRYNRAGAFNNSLHHGRPGIHPDRLGRVIGFWSSAIQDVTFVRQDFRESLAAAREGDFVFLDPPYSKTKGRYSERKFSDTDLWKELAGLNRRGVQWMLTYDGFAGKRSYETEVPRELYRQRFYIVTGNSPFSRLMGSSIDAVHEAVYVNFNPPVKALRSLVDGVDSRQRIRIINGDVDVDPTLFPIKV